MSAEVLVATLECLKWVGYRLLDTPVAYRSGAAVQSTITVDCLGHMRGGLPPVIFPAERWNFLKRSCARLVGG